MAPIRHSRRLYPIMRCCRVALAGHVFCEKHVTGTESHPGPVAEPDVDSTGEGMTHLRRGARCQLTIWGAKSFLRGAL